MTPEKWEYIKKHAFYQAYLKGKISHEEFFANLRVFENDLFEADFIKEDIEELKRVLSKINNIERGMNILKEHNFPINKYLMVANLLAQHPDDLEEMAKAAGKDTEQLFKKIKEIQIIIKYSEITLRVIHELLKLHRINKQWRILSLAEQFKIIAKKEGVEGLQNESYYRCMELLAKRGIFPTYTLMRMVYVSGRTSSS